MPSTLVSIAGNVLSTRFDSIPGRNGSKCLGSKVSVWAIPPAIHNSTRQSAEANCGGGSACTAGALSMARAAAEALASWLRNSRRYNWRAFIVLLNQLELRQHRHGPNQVAYGILRGDRPENVCDQSMLASGWLTPQKHFEYMATRHGRFAKAFQLGGRRQVDHLFECAAID